MSTNCEYKPVHSTLRNSADSEGNDVVMLGKKAISCFGGSMEGVGKGILLVVVKCLLADTAVVGKFDVTWESRTVLFCTSE